MGEMGLHFLAEEAFDDLLTTWRAVDDVRHARRELSLRRRDELHRSLDAARDRMRRLRLALHPEPDVRARARLSVLCDTLDVVVHLGDEHVDDNRPGCFRCACGDLVPIHRTG